MSLRQHNLSTAIDVQVVLEYTAAGTSTLTSTAVDLQTNGSFDSCLFLAWFGTAATDNTLHIESSAATGGTYLDITDSEVASGATNQLVAIDIAYADKQFLKAIATRATSSTLEFCIAIKYHAKDGLTAPASWTSNASYELHTWAGSSSGGK